MEQGNSVTDKEREVCEILLNLLPYLIKKSESYDDLIVWGVRGKRSAIDLPPSPPHHCSPPKIDAEGSSPDSPFSLPSTESDEKTQQYGERLQAKMSREVSEPTWQIGSNSKAASTGAREGESHHSKPKACNKMSKAKQEDGLLLI